MQAVRGQGPGVLNVRPTHWSTVHPMFSGTHPTETHGQLEAAVLQVWWELLGVGPSSLGVSKPCSGL